MSKYLGVIASAILANGLPPAAAEEVMAAKNIRAGTPVSPIDIMPPRSHEAMRRAASMIGMETTHTIYKGQAFDTYDLRTPILVKRNAIVQMEFSKGTMTIAAEGRALSDGSLGDRIRVMNLLSKRVITMTVSGEQSVTVN